MDLLKGQMAPDDQTVLVKIMTFKEDGGGGEGGREREEEREKKRNGEANSG